MDIKIRPMKIGEKKGRLMLPLLQALREEKKRAVPENLKALPLLRPL